MTVDLPETEQVKRSRELAIIHAFFLPGSAAQIAQAFSTDTRKLHAADVHRIWAEAKERGDLPKIDRPAGGPGATVQPKGEKHEAHH